MLLALTDRISRVFHVTRVLGATRIALVLIDSLLTSTGDVREVARLVSRSITDQRAAFDTFIRLCRGCCGLGRGIEGDSHELFIVSGLCKVAHTEKIVKFELSLEVER